MKGAAQMNSMQLIGRLTSDAERRSPDSGGERSRKLLAVPDRDRDTEPVYVDVVCFDAQATAGPHAGPGRPEDTVPA